MRTRSLVALALVAGCKGAPPDDGAPATGARAAAAVAIPAGAVRVDGANFHVDAGAAAACRAQTTCEVRVHVTATNGFKVNQDYPFKFLAAAAPGVTVEGVEPFVPQGTKTGYLVVRVRPAAAGTARVGGTVKLSVCNDQQCLIEEPAIAVDVPVS